MFLQLNLNRCPVELKPFQGFLSFFHQIFSYENLIFSNIFMELLMENKEKVMDGDQFDLKFTVLKTDLKMLFHLISSIRYIAMFSTQRGMSRDLNEKVSWFLLPLRPKTFSLEGEKNNVSLEMSVLSIPFRKV